VCNFLRVSAWLLCSGKKLLDSEEQTGELSRESVMEFKSSAALLNVKKYHCTMLQLACVIIIQQRTYVSKRLKQFLQSVMYHHLERIMSLIKMLSNSISSYSKTTGRLFQ